MKRLFIRIIEILLLSALLLPILPAAALEDSSAQLFFEVPAGRESFAFHLADDNDTTRFTLLSGESLKIRWPLGQPGKVLLHWFDVNYQIVLRFYSAEGSVLSEKEHLSVPYRMSLDIPRNAVCLEITAKKGHIASLCGVDLLPENAAVPYLTKKQSVDLMLILSGVTEEVDLLGGLLPLYAGEYGMRTAIVYVGRDYGDRVQEAFRAFAAMGIDVIPVFLQHDDHTASSADKVKSLWRPNKVQDELLSVFRQYKPKVVVTCDPKDSFSMPRTAYTAKIVRDVIKRKSDMRHVPVQKIYYLSPDGSTQLDWTIPLSSYHGSTAQEIAQTGYSCYASEKCFGVTVPEQCRLKLAYTTVGEDEEGNDLFEHVEGISERPSLQDATEKIEPGIGEQLQSAVALQTAAFVRASDPDSVYFRQPGEPPEVVISDYDSGHWEYRSDILSIIIDRHILRENNKPYWRYIAHIRMREVNSFRPLTSSNYTKAAATEPPWRLARNCRSILAITGDNINNADSEDKGIIIRNGNLYLDGNKEDTLVMDRDMTMRIVHAGECAGVDLLDDGVLATYSFGPVLVENHQVNPLASQHRVFKENPRCGIGMVKPGHFVAIVTDGRDEKRAYGNTLQDFAQMFIDEGAVCAYNLDGGSSAGMVFMGEHINWHTVGTQRGWADCLSWGFSTQVPGVGDPLIRQGNRSFY